MLDCIPLLYTRDWGHLIPKKNYCYYYSDFLKHNEIVFYKNISDLNKKIIYYKNNQSKLKKIARNGYIKSHKIFNNKLVSDFIVKKSMGINLNNKLNWMNA